MATTYSSNLKLGRSATGDTGWGSIIVADWNILDAVAPVGGLAVTTHETPSTTLLVDIAAGYFLNHANVLVSYAGAASQAVTTATTNYIYLTNAGVLTINTSGFPAAPAFHVPLATVLAGATTVTSVTDRRCAINVAGNGITSPAFASTINLDLSTANWFTPAALTGNITLTVSNPTAGQEFTLVLLQDGTGSRLVTAWFSGILWPGAAAPTLTTTANRRDVFRFKIISAGVYLAAIVGQNIG